MGSITEPVNEEYRICTVCSKKMYEGFYVCGNYYCNESCLHVHYTIEEYEELYYEDEYGDTDAAYWTVWQLV